MTIQRFFTPEADVRTQTLTSRFCRGSGNSTCSSPSRGLERIETLLLWHQKSLTNLHDTPLQTGLSETICLQKSLFLSLRYTSPDGKQQMLKPSKGFTSQHREIVQGLPSAPLPHRFWSDHQCAAAFHTVSKQHAQIYLLIWQQCILAHVEHWLISSFSPHQKSQKCQIETLKLIWNGRSFHP